MVLRDFKDEVDQTFMSGFHDSYSLKSFLEKPDRFKNREILQILIRFYQTSLSVFKIPVRVKMANLILQDEWYCYKNDD